MLNNFVLNYEFLAVKNNVNFLFNLFKNIVIQ